MIHLRMSRRHTTRKSAGKAIQYHRKVHNFECHLRMHQARIAESLPSIRATTQSHCSDLDSAKMYPR